MLRILALAAAARADYVSTLVTGDVGCSAPPLMETQSHYACMAWKNGTSYTLSCTGTSAAKLNVFANTQCSGTSTSTLAPSAAGIDFGCEPYHPPSPMYQSVTCVKSAGLPPPIALSAAAGWSTSEGFYGGTCAAPAASFVRSAIKVGCGGGCVTSGSASILATCVNKSSSRIDTYAEAGCGGPYLPNFMYLADMSVACAVGSLPGAGPVLYAYAAGTTGGFFWGAGSTADGVPVIIPVIIGFFLAACGSMRASSTSGAPKLPGAAPRAAAGAGNV